ncbi:DUF6668 family protein [Rothia sp. ZJ932]|uniref:DUF6668 family protein n=1 Tax=Rothia sp. ZJ932 TaxID=2810516 RepID=UPI00196746B7|nr:DUF6668 family protein [Rothia sp. ZJ932]QRZ61788.1 hypothetical protein JR346_01200 [Rothia sp. ZJ932]
MVLFTRKPVMERVANPLALTPVVQEAPEQMSTDEIIGSASATHFTGEFPAPEGVMLVPVAGGVGLSTLVKASGGMLQEPDDGHIASSAILVATTAATHLARAAFVLRRGYADNGANVIGVVLVHDRPHLSKATVKESQKVIRMTKHGWVIPWVADLREPGVSLVKYPKRYRKVVEELARVTR